MAWEKAICKELGKTSVIVLAGRNLAKMEAAKAELDELGVESCLCKTDIADRAQVQALADFAASLGDVTQVIHTSGVSPSDTATENIIRINADGTVATVKPFVGYFYRDNNCIGVRFGYRHMSGTLDNTYFDAGEGNDLSGQLPYIDLSSDNYSFGIFHRSYAGLDPKGRFGLFAEFELALSTGTSNFLYDPDRKEGGNPNRTYSDNTQVKLSFNPGAAVYIFPNVCATLSFGLGGIQYNSVTQKDADGNKVGSRKASNMRFRLNIAAINFGMTIHLWDKKKQ